MPFVFVICYCCGLFKTNTLNFRVWFIQYQTNVSNTFYRLLYLVLEVVLSMLKWHFLVKYISSYNN